MMKKNLQNILNKVKKKKLDMWIQVLKITKKFMLYKLNKKIRLKKVQKKLKVFLCSINLTITKIIKICFKVLKNNLAKIKKNIKIVQF